MDDNFKLAVYIRKMFTYDVELYHRSTQVLRFKLTCGAQQMKLEKRLLEKRFPWKVIEANFKFKKEDAAQNMDMIFQLLDAEIKPPIKRQAHWKNNYNGQA